MASAVAVSLSCASSSPFVERASPPRQTPWLVPATELETQRLFRVRLETPEGRGRIRLQLRVRTEDEYRIDSTHPLFNRRLWSFGSSSGHGLLVDYTQKVACRYEGDIEIAALPLGPFAQKRLPALLLGYPPVAGASSPRGGTDGEVRDRSGRRWTVDRGADGVVGWVLWDDGEPRAEWRLEEEWAVLEARDEGIRVRWRETVREASERPIQKLEIPAGFAREGCDLGWMKGVEDTWEVDEN